MRDALHERQCARHIEAHRASAAARAALTIVHVASMNKVPAGWKALTALPGISE